MAEYDKNLIDIFKKFPDQNPNPILRLSIEGILKYHNQPSKPIINFFGLKIHKKVNQDFLKHIHPTLSKWHQYLWHRYHRKKSY